MLFRYRGAALQPEATEGAAPQLDGIGGSVRKLHFHLDAIGQLTPLGLLQRSIETQQQIKVAYSRRRWRPAQERPHHLRGRPPQAVQPVARRFEVPDGKPAPVREALVRLLQERVWIDKHAA